MTNRMTRIHCDQPGCLGGLFTNRGDPAPREDDQRDCETCARAARDIANRKLGAGIRTAMDLGPESVAAIDYVLHFLDVEGYDEVDSRFTTACDVLRVVVGHLRPTPGIEPGISPAPEGTGTGEIHDL